MNIAWIVAAFELCVIVVLFLLIGIVNSMYVEMRAKYHKGQEDLASLDRYRHGTTMGVSHLGKR